MKTINLAPTWRSALPIMIAAIEDGTAEGRRIAREELARMATLADQANERGDLLAEIVNMRPAVFRLMKTKIRATLTRQMKEAR